MRWLSLFAAVVLSGCAHVHTEPLPRPAAADEPGVAQALAFLKERYLHVRLARKVDVTVHDCWCGKLVVARADPNAGFDCGGCSLLVLGNPPMALATERGDVLPFSVGLDGPMEQLCTKACER